MYPFHVWRVIRLSAIASCFAITIANVAPGQTAQAPPVPAATPAGQSTAPAPASAPTIRVTAREVLLDVLVIDKNGQPVTGLNASDFSVAEEGEAQIIRRVNEHRAMDTEAMSKLTAAPELPPNTFTNFTPVRNTNASIVLLLDAMDSPVEAQMAMRQQLIDFLKHMQPGPPVAIFQLDTEMRLIQGFTSDPKVLLAAAESKRDMPSLAKPTAAPRSYAGDAVYRRTLMEILRDGMHDLGSYLAGYPGRKNLIWFTGRVPMTRTGMGFGYPFGDGMTVSDSEDETHALTDVLTVSHVAVYPVDTRGLMVMPRSMTAASARNPGPMAIPPMGYASHANMEVVARETGGKAYYDSNDFTRVIEDVIRTGSSYYTIAYATTNTKWNGELRRIAVTVDRPDVEVRHKEGYRAYSLDKREEKGIAAIEKRAADQAEQQASGEAEDNQANEGNSDAGAKTADAGLGETIHHAKTGGFQAAMALGAIPPTEIVFSARLEPDANIAKIEKNATMPPGNFLAPEWQHKPFRNYAIVYNADVHRARFTRTADGVRHGTLEFAAIAYFADGEMVNSILKTISLDVTPEQYRELLVSGMEVKQEIAVPAKGNFFLRLGVHDKEGDQVGALEIPVDQVRLDIASANAQTP